MSKTRSFRAIWSSADFRKLAFSQVLAGMGEWIATMALIALVWERTHSALASGLVLSFRILPAAVLGTLLGGIVDRLDRKRVMVAATAGRALVYGLLPLVGGVMFVLVLALVAEVAALVYASARDAALPKLCTSELLPAANAISLASAYGTMPIGSGIFAGFALMGHAGIEWALGAAGGLLAIATLIVGKVTASMDSTVEERIGEKLTMLQGLRALRQVVRDDPILRRVAIGGTVAAAGGGAIITLGLAYVRGTLHAGPGAYGGLLTAFCAGAGVGVFAIQRARRVIHHVFHAGIGAMGAILLLMALLPSTAVGMGMAFIFGASFVATFLGGITVVQDRVSDALRGRAFSLAHSGLRVGAVVVGVLAAWAAKALGEAPRSFGSLRMDGNQLVLFAAGLMLFLVAAAMLRPLARARA